jgi:hypothetical protein
MKEFLKLIKILIIIYVICHILHKLNINIKEGFEGETCQNKCTRIIDESTCNNDNSCNWNQSLYENIDSALTDAELPCQPNNIISETVWIPSSDVDGVITAGSLSCGENSSVSNESLNQCPTDKPILSLNSNVNIDYTFTEDDIPRCIPLAVCAAVAADSSFEQQKTCFLKQPTQEDCGSDTDCQIVDAAEDCSGDPGDPITNCPIGCGHYPAGFKRQWENKRYGREGDLTSIINKKPTCILKNINDSISEIEDQMTYSEYSGLCSNLQDGELLTPDICEGISATDDETEDTNKNIRSRHCSWIPPTGNDGTELNTYNCLNNTGNAMSIDYVQSMCETQPTCFGWSSNPDGSTNEDKCSNVDDCSYNVEGSCFNNTDSSSDIICPDKYSNKINPDPNINLISFNPSAGASIEVRRQEEIDQCCLARTEYCTNNFDQTEDIVCPSGKTVLNPDTDIKSVNPAHDQVQICCKESNNTDIQMNIKLEGDYSIVNQDRNSFETNFKNDLVEILNQNNITKPEINTSYTIEDIIIINIESGSISVTFELQDGLSIKSDIETVFETDLTFRTLNTSNVRITRIEEAIILNTEEVEDGFLDGKIAGIEKLYILISLIVSFVLSCMSCCFLILIMAL